MGRPPCTQGQTMLYHSAATEPRIHYAETKDGLNKEEAARLYQARCREA